LIRAKRISVLRVRSCASSMIRPAYLARSGSVRNPRSSIPSVIYLRTVLSLAQSSKWFKYVTETGANVLGDTGGYRHCGDTTGLGAPYFKVVLAVTGAPRVRTPTFLRVSTADAGHL